MEAIRTWDKILDAADSCGYGDEPLKVKDTARAAVRGFMMDLGHSDPDNAEIPEDCIGEFCRKLKVLFDECGNIASFKFPFWIEMLIYTARDDSYLKQDIGYMAESIAESRGLPQIEISENDMDKIVFEYRVCEDGNVPHNVTLENAIDEVLGDKLSDDDTAKRR